MARKRGGGSPEPHDLATRNYAAAVGFIKHHPLFEPLAGCAWFQRAKDDRLPDDEGWCEVDDDGLIRVHPTRRGEVEEWIHVIAHALLHLGFEHFRDGVQSREWNAACCVYVERFLKDLRIGRAPWPVPADLPSMDERRLYAAFLQRGVPRELEGLGVCGGAPDMVLDPAQRSGPRWRRRYRKKGEPWSQLLATGLQEAVQSAVEVAAGRKASLSDDTAVLSSGQLAREWFLDRFPLLGGIAAHFEVIEDADLCRRLNIGIAAVDEEYAKFYMNPRAGLGPEETRFVMAHEFMHVALRHAARQLGRDFYRWNLAGDYTINDWLIEMRIGKMPVVGGLHDASLRGLSTEEIYDRIVRDLRVYRRLETFRGGGLGDMMTERPPEWWLHGAGRSLDELYRSLLAQGLQYHEELGRGLLPAGLVEEIRSIIQPPILWNVKLAHWFDARFQPLERVRSYARASRRQSATPDIPRPHWAYRPEDLEGRTFGVIFDTSWSQSPRMLGLGLGTVASYARAREVRGIRVVHCDAAPYDQGFVEPERLLNLVEVKGRGGTVLQPGIDLLENARDFPKEAPILIVTDGQCDRLTIRRDHAFLLPQGGVLPFAPRGQVFRIEG